MVGVVVPATGVSEPKLTSEQVARVQRAVARDKAFAAAQAVAKRLRAQLDAGHQVAAEEVEILVDYFLEHG